MVVMNIYQALDGTPSDVVSRAQEAVRILESWGYQVDETTRQDIQRELASIKQKTGDALSTNEAYNVARAMVDRMSGNDLGR